MRLSYIELNNCMEAMKTAVGNDKTGASNIIILSNPSDSTVRFIGISPSYQVIKTIQPQFEDSDTRAEIILNYKKLSELVAMSKSTSGIDTEIIINIDTERKELQYSLTKYASANTGYAESLNNRQVLSKIRQRLNFTFVEDDKRRGGLDVLNIDWLMSLTDDSVENSNTTVWDITNFITVMSKMTAGDAGQIIMSNQTKVVATCHSNYAVYKEDPSAALSVVLQSNVVEKLITILRSVKNNKQAEQKVVLHKETGRLIVFDEAHSFIVQTDIPLAKKLMLSHINGFNSADYRHAGAVVRKDIMLDIIKCFETMTGSEQTNLKFIVDNEDQFIRLEVPNSNSRQNDMMLRVQNMLGDSDVDNKTFSVTLSTIIQMLNTCDTQTVCLSIALPEQLDDTPAETEQNTQSLLKIASLLENNTEGLKCYSILG